MVQINDNNCARCRSCLKKCPHHILDMVNDENGLRVVVKYPERCSGCGGCISVCNFHALKLVEWEYKN